jgi:hypothetical protein
MYVPADEDVRVLLADLKVDPEGAGCKNAADRLRLLQKALQKTQHLKHIPKKAGDSTQTFDPSTLRTIDSRGKLMEKEFDGEKMYSMQVRSGADPGSWHPNSPPPLPRIIHSTPPPAQYQQ